VQVWGQAVRPCHSPATTTRAGTGRRCCCRGRRPTLCPDPVPVRGYPGPQALHCACVPARPRQCGISAAPSPRALQRPRCPGCRMPRGRHAPRLLSSQCCTSSCSGRSSRTPTRQWQTCGLLYGLWTQTQCGVTWQWSQQWRTWKRSARAQTSTTICTSTRFVGGVWRTGPSVYMVQWSQQQPSAQT